MRRRRRRGGAGERLQGRFKRRRDGRRGDRRGRRGVRPRSGDQGHAGGDDGGFVPAGHPALPQVITYGGPVLAAPKVQPIAYSSDLNLRDMDTFLQELTTTSFWSQATAEYGESDSQGSCCSGYDAYHSETMSGNLSIPYAVSRACSGFDGPDVTDLHERTVNVSHELVEAATEPPPRTAIPPMA